MLGVRQKESDFDYSASMLFSPRDDGSESGLLLFQKDDNYIRFTITRRQGDHVLAVVVARPDMAARTITETILDDYRGAIELRVVSKDHRYELSYSQDQGGIFTDFAELEANHILSKGYTGAYLGIYSTANGGDSNDYADFDRVQYESFPRH